MKNIKRIAALLLALFLVVTMIPMQKNMSVVSAGESDTYDLKDKKSYSLDATYNSGCYIAPKKAGTYPVLFMVHGANGMGSRETDFINDMNKWISLGYVDPVVIVFPHIRQIKEKEWGIIDFGEYTSNGYLKTLVDYIKAGNLTDKADKESPMSITGYSMGGATALHAGVTYPDTFINIGAASPSWCFYTGENGSGWIKKAKDMVFSKSEDAHFMMAYGDGEGEWKLDNQGNKCWCNGFEYNVGLYNDAINNNGMNTKDMFKIYKVSKSYGGHGWNVFHREMFYFLYYLKTEHEPSAEVIETACAGAKTAMYGNASISGTCKVGSTLTASISNSNVSSYAYKWKVGKNYIEGAYASTYTLKDSDAGKKVSCEITDKSGKLSGVICATSDVVEKKDNSKEEKKEETKKPVIESVDLSLANGYVKKGQNYTITVKATGENLKYQWEWCTDKKGWANSVCDGNTSKTIHLVGKRPVVYYRCKVTSGKESVTSNAVEIKMSTPMIESVDLSLADGYVKQGQNYTITVKATGENLKYQWEWCTDKKGWANSVCDGNTSKTIHLVGKRPVVYYRCKVTSGNETVTSDVVEIKMSK